VIAPSLEAHDHEVQVLHIVVLRGIDAPGGGERLIALAVDAATRGLSGVRLSVANVTVAHHASEKIDGGTSVVISTNDGVIRLTNDGTSRCTI
jgi:hypothetical protein